MLNLYFVHEKSVLIKKEENWMERSREKIMEWLRNMLVSVVTPVYNCEKYFFMRMMNMVAYVYRQTAGLWWENRYRPLMEAFSNLFLNILLVRKFGVTGVMLSTVMTMLPFNTIWGSTILFRNYFSEEKQLYYLLRLCY